MDRKHQFLGTYVWRGAFYISRMRILCWHGHLSPVGIIPLWTQVIASCWEISAWSRRSRRASQCSMANFPALDDEIRWKNLGSTSMVRTIRNLWYHIRLVPLFLRYFGPSPFPQKKHVAESAGKIWQTTWLMIAATNWGPFYDRNPLIRA